MVRSLAVAHFVQRRRQEAKAGRLPVVDPTYPAGIDESRSVAMQLAHVGFKRSRGLDLVREVRGSIGRGHADR
jgi:hypothetical protein